MKTLAEPTQHNQKSPIGGIQIDFEYVLGGALNTLLLPYRFSHGQPENLQNCLLKHKVKIFRAMLKNIINSEKLPVLYFL